MKPIFFLAVISLVSLKAFSQQESIDSLASKISNKIEVSESRLFFISEDSKKPADYNHKQENDLGVVNFIKNDSWVSCKNLTPIDNQCDLSLINKENILKRLKKPNVFEGMVVKALNSSQHQFNFKKDTTYAVLLFSFKLSSFINYQNYINVLKKLEETSGINYIIIASDYTDNTKQ